MVYIKARNALDGLQASISTLKHRVVVPHRVYIRIAFPGLSPSLRCLRLTEPMEDRHPPGFLKRAGWLDFAP